MKPIDKRFRIVWTALAGLMMIVIAYCSWNEDTAILGIAFALSLLSTWLCHRIRPKAALSNLLVMLLYNAILGYNLIFNSCGGTGFTWWFYLLVLNAIHSIGLIVFAIISAQKRHYWFPQKNEMK